MKIYLDNAATTMIDPKVLEAMQPYLKNNYGNASSIYTLGQASRYAIDKAREQVADFLKCKPKEIIFTGSATEANNIAILSFSNALNNAEKNKTNIHIITSAIEHPAVLEPYKRLAKQGIDITYLPVSKDGLVKVEDVEKAIKIETRLISIMYANNEIGTIQPIIEIGAMLKKINKERRDKIYFHTDAVQAANYLNCDVNELGVDMLTLSGHKIYGPKGVGALYAEENVPIKPIIFGGHQENGLRPGTENVPNIVGLGEAVEQIKGREEINAKVFELRAKLVNGILELIPQTIINGSMEKRLPNNINFSFKGAEGEAVVMSLDQEGIATSTGSACSSGSLEPSHVLLALGMDKEQAHGSLRITLGKYNNEKEINRVLEVLPEVISRLREISGYKIK